MFLMVEYRSWATPLDIFNPLILFEPRSWFDMTKYPSIVQSRSLGILLAGVVAGMFGYDPVPHDVVQIGLLASSGALLAGLVWRILPGSTALVVAGAPLFLLFSEPFLDALTWQATTLDKLALFFTSLGLFLCAGIFPEDRRLRTVITSNVVLGIVTFAAYNSKEAAYPLVPVMVGLIALRSLLTTGQLTRLRVTQALSTSARFLALPIAYACFHIGVVFTNRVFLNPAEASRVMGGDAFANGFQFAVDMLNARALLAWWGSEVPARDVVVSCVLGAIVALAAAGIVIWRNAPRADALLWTWALVAFGLALAIPIRTTAGSPFYLLVPTFYLTVFLATSIRALAHSAHLRSSPRGAQIALAFLLALHVGGFTAVAPRYTAFQVRSANFTVAVDQLRDLVRAGGTFARIAFYWPTTEPRAYMFLDSDGSRALGEYVLGKDKPAAAYAAINVAIKDQSYTGPPPVPHAVPDTVSFVLGDELRVVSVVPASR